MSSTNLRMSLLFTGCRNGRVARKEAEPHCDLLILPPQRAAQKYLGEGRRLAPPTSHQPSRGRTSAERRLSLDFTVAQHPSKWLHPPLRSLTSQPLSPLCQLISADSAYSKNVQWPIDYFQPSPATSSEECISYADYCQREGVSSYPSPASYSEKHSTRSPFAYHEILFRFPEGTEPGKPSEVTVTGSLSDRSTYSFDLSPPSELGDSNFIGAEVSDPQ